MTPWYSWLTDLGDRGGETAIRSIRRASLAIRADIFCIAKAEIRRAALAIIAEKVLIARAALAIV